MSPLNFFVGSSSSTDHEAQHDEAPSARDDEERSSGSEDEQDLDVEDLLWAAQVSSLANLMSLCWNGTASSSG